MTLTKYIKKRNFKKTPEPKGKVLRPSKKLTFVVQRHDAEEIREELHHVLHTPQGQSEPIKGTHEGESE